MRTETLAIVFTDIKGYTAATSTQTHVQNAALLRSMAAMVTPVVKAFDGRIVKSIGDAYMIVFRSPTDAVRCSLAIQNRLHQYNSQRHPDAGIHIRIAMNIGEVRVERGDVFGDPVNISSRIEGVTPADEVYFSEAIYLTMNHSEIPFERVGDYELKGIPEPVTVFRAKRFADAADDAQPVGLPFGGRMLAYYERVRWLRRAYQAVWLFALFGLAGAAYLRYRPETDYSYLVTAMKAAVEANKPTEALALGGQIPQNAVQERMLARRYRRQAASQLYERGEIDTARTEVEALLVDDPRDADALLLKGLVLAKKDDLRSAFAALNDAMKLNGALAQQPELVSVAAKGLADPGARKAADAFIDAYLRQSAIPALIRLMQTSQDRNVRQTVATRLDKLGAGQEVDWVWLALEDLKSTSCKTKRTAIARLMQEGDERAVGPLMKLGENKNCVSALALKAADTILGEMMLALCLVLLLQAPAKNATFVVNDPGAVVDLSGFWLFQAGDNPVFAQPSHDDGRWDQRRVPTQSLAATFRWAGYGWYRIHLAVDTAVVSSDLLLGLGPAREAIEVYVNGSLVAERGRFGSRPQGGTRLTPLVAVVPSGLLRPGDNVVAVRVFDPTWAGGLPSGPPLIGAPNLVRARLAGQATGALAVNVGLALVALCIGLGQLLGRTRIQGSGDLGWLVLAAFGLSVFHASGTGLLEASLPSLELALRVPWIAAYLAAVSLASYFAFRYADGWRGRWPVRALVLFTGSALLLLLPDRWIFFSVRPFLLCAALAAALYAAGITAQAVRRQEPGALYVFASLLAMVFFTIADSLDAVRSEVFPPLSAVGAVGVLVVATFISVRQVSHEYVSMAQRVQSLEKALDDRTIMGILDATALSIRNANAFLDVAIREAALELGLRRCSLVLAQRDGSLRIEASVGLPKHVTQSPVQRDGSIVGWVFEHGQGLSASSLPAELQSFKRSGRPYLTDAFISQPVQVGAQIMGVLNVSDRNDGRPFDPSDEFTVQEVCAKIAMVLQRVRETPKPRTPDIPLAVGRVPEET